jgi:hypothetical protein
MERPVADDTALAYSSVVEVTPARLNSSKADECRVARVRETLARRRHDHACTRVAQPTANGLGLGRGRG